MTATVNQAISSLAYCTRKRSNQVPERIYFLLHVLFTDFPFNVAFLHRSHHCTARRGGGARGVAAPVPATCAAGSLQTAHDLLEGRAGLPDISFSLGVPTLAKERDTMALG